jgi:hypothetical protein
VARSRRPLTPMVQEVFLVEIRRRCADAVIAAQLFGLGQTLGNHDLEWLALGTIVSSAAYISRLTGGNSGERRAERASLRALLGIDDHSVLHQASVKASMGHIDERIFEALEDGRLSGFIDYNILDVSLLKFSGHPANPQPAFLLNFNPETGIVTFYEDQISIPEVLAEIRRIFPLVDAALEQPRRIGGLQG